MKIVSGLLLAGSLLSGVAFAKDATPLVGVEAGYGSMNAGGSSHNLYTGGLKIGAQSDDYRVYLSARTIQINGFESGNALGGEFQYLIPIHTGLNAFMGVNAGQIGMKTKNLPTPQRDISTYYYGGDLGVNMALSPSIDLEMGGRLMYMNYTHTLGGVAYNVDSIVQGYASLVFKLPNR